MSHESKEIEANEKSDLLKGVPMATLQETLAREKREKEFRRSQMKRLGIPEWRVLLALAYNGSQSRYQIAKEHNLKYPVVHRATKSLVEIGWIENVDTKLSVKNVNTQIYNLTREGLLWLFSKLTRNVHASLVDFSLSDSLGLRRAMEEEDLSVLGNLRRQQDVYLHLLWMFDIDRIAKNNAGLFPLVFGEWDFYNEIGVAKDIAHSFPEAAFTTLLEYYIRCQGPQDKLSALDQVFTQKVYSGFLDLYAGGYAFVPEHIEYRNDSVQKVVMVMQRNPDLHRIFQKISKMIGHKHTESLNFIKRIRESRT